MKPPYPIISAVLLTLAAASAAAQLPKLDHTLGNARATASGDTLTVTTGAITQQWTLVPAGLATTSLVNPATGKEWCAPDNTTCDWGFYGLLDNKPAKLISLTAATDNDEGFAADHIRVLAEFEYPAAATTVRYEIWAYPGANGLMTRLWFKGNGEKNFTKPAPVKSDIVLARTAFNSKQLYYYSLPLRFVQPDWFNSMARDNAKPLSLFLENLDPAKSYRIGLSFWNTLADETENQEVRLAVGKNKTISLINNVAVKSYNKDKAKPLTVFADIPAGTLTGGAATVLISNKKPGRFSFASEIIIYEKSDKPRIREIMSTVPARMPALEAGAPKGWRLVGYNNLGSRPGTPPASPNGYIARLPIAGAGGATRLYGGYFIDTQNRNLREMPLLREDVYANPIHNTERVGWASFVSLQNGADGLVMLKESQKCVNQFGCDTGDFALDNASLTNTGLGLEIKDIVADKYTRTWGNWTIVHTGGDVALAVKKFDRARFRPAGKITVMSNTWGTTGPNPRYEAREDNVLREITSGADLGLDAVEIDGGWYGLNDKAPCIPAKSATLKGVGEYRLYPDGWKNVRAAAQKHNILLGLWHPEYATLDEMTRNYDEGGFRYFKIDFMHMNTRAEIDSLENKLRALILHSKHNIILNIDSTEGVARFGMYTGRQYGDNYLENRMQNTPTNTIYTPYLVLRDAWHASKYINLNKLQVTIQDAAAVNREMSNASLHSQGYLTAIALMSSPILMFQTQKLAAPARDATRALIAAWKRERDNLARGYVDPIGDEPDDASWTGFQNYTETSPDGYLLLFRELNNTQPSSAIALKYCAGKKLRLTDFMTGQSFEAAADGQGRVTFTMDKPGDYRFYKYTIL